MDLFSEQQLFIGGGFVVVAVLLMLLVPRKDPLSNIPGPWYAKWTDDVALYYSLTARKPSWVESLHQKYGPVVRVGAREVYISDPVAAQQIHRIKNEFAKSDWYTKLVPGTTNVFNTTNIMTHRRLRKLLSSPLAEGNLKRMLPLIDSKVRLTIQRIQEESETRGVADVFKWWLFMATDVIGELSFGESFNMLESRQINQYVVDLRNVGKFGAIRGGFPNIVWLAMKLSLPLPIFAEVRRARQRFIDYSLQSIQRHRNLIENEGEDAKPSLLSKLYKAEGDESLSFNELRDSAQAYIVAGSDTTSNTLTYLTWEVCRHPDVKEKLARELKKLDDDFTYEDVKNLPYLSHVIEEVLRLHPAVPAGLPRVVPPEGAELAGHHIPGGYVVSTQTYSLHGNEEVFPEAHEFIPSRWENPTKLMKDSVMPFGGGSRICLGLHLARIELRLAVARFFKAFPNAKVSTKEGMSGKDMDKKLYFLIAPAGGRCLIELS
ncbi:cytochrome P450 [Xylariaceae sp. FL0016]|nr:cytochrome P450 [Xylariaceae sp. FL0016]